MNHPVDPKCVPPVEPATGPISGAFAAGLAKPEGRVHTEAQPRGGPAAAG